MLTKEQLHDIKTLQQLCENEGGFQLKLNFDMLESREDHNTDDFFHYLDGQLIGFLGSYYFGSKVELCGMVHPDYRRKGIFKKLLDLGLAEAKMRGAKTILLNAPTDSQTAKGFIKSIPSTFKVAEYQMKWHKTDLNEDPSITIRPSVSDEDIEAEIQLDISGFDLNEEDVRAMFQKRRDNSSELNLIIEAEGKTAGKMRISEENGEAWIYGFVIFSELRGKGIGRKALSRVVKMENQKGLSIYLEVEAQNARALELYQSCGFKSYHSQDYYEYQG